MFRRHGLPRFALPPAALLFSASLACADTAANGNAEPPVARSSAAPAARIQPLLLHVDTSLDRATVALRLRDLLGDKTATTDAGIVIGSLRAISPGWYAFDLSCNTASGCQRARTLIESQHEWVIDLRDDVKRHRLTPAPRLRP